MRNPNTPSTTEEQSADWEPSAEAVETAKKTVVEKSRAWADAGDTLEAAQANQIRLTQELEAADLAFRESLEKLQQIAGIGVMLEVLDNLENLVAASEETDDGSLETPSWRPLA